MAPKNITCVIKYDNNIDGIYYSGDLLSGTVTLTLTKTKTVRGISLTVLGQAQAEWSTGTGRRNRVHTGKEDYLKSINYLLGEKNGPDIDIQPGVYNYTFACVLSPLLPTSFEHKTGSIKYTVTVNLDRPFYFDDTFTVLFTVLKRVDLNYESPEMRLPVGRSQNKSLYCCCIQYGKMNINVSTPQKGYVPGQSIDVDVDLRGDIEKVYKLKFILQKILTFNSDSGRSKVKTENLFSEQHTGPISSHNRKSLVVPCVIPTLDPLSSIIHITYHIMVTVCISRPHSNPHVFIPITIGTMPLSVVAPSAPLINHNQCRINHSSNRGMTRERQNSNLYASVYSN